MAKLPVVYVPEEWFGRVHALIGDKVRLYILDVDGAPMPDLILGPYAHAWREEWLTVKDLKKALTAARRRAKDG